MKEFYALAIEENGGYGLLDGNVMDGGNQFKTIEQAKKAREKHDCSCALDIVYVKIIE